MLLSILDLNKCVVQAFPSNQWHQDKIEAIVYSSLMDRDNNKSVLTNAVLTASEDRTLRIWDRASGKVEMNLRYKN